MEEWLVEHKIPLGVWIKSAIEFLEENASLFFDLVKDGLGSLIDSFTALMLLVPVWALIAIFVGLTYALHRSWRLVALVLISMIVIVNQGYWAETIETLSLVTCATLVCVIIGVPIGIAAAHRPWLYAVLRPVLDLMQTIPTFVYLIPTLVFFGLGVVPGLISTVIFALPAPVRLTHLGVSAVPPALIEAGKAFGATTRQLLWKVEIPYAMPTIMAGVNQCIMLSLSMVVIAALVGAGGLGKPVVRALNQVNIPMGFEAGLCIVLLAIILDRVCKQPVARRKD